VLDALRVFVKFRRDPLNPGRLFFEAIAALYAEDMAADGPIYKYRLVREKPRASR
jgi:hypothetical protein